MIMKENKEINDRSVLTTRLLAGVVQTVPRLQAGYLDS